MEKWKHHSWYASGRDISQRKHRSRQTKYFTSNCRTVWQGNEIEFFLFDILFNFYLNIFIWLCSFSFNTDQKNQIQVQYTICNFTDSMIAQFCKCDKCRAIRYKILIRRRVRERDVLAYSRFACPTRYLVGKRIANIQTYHSAKCHFYCTVKKKKKSYHFLHEREKKDQEVESIVRKT